MKSTKPNWYWSSQSIELLLLALTLLATVVISALTLRQTTKHFEIERTSSFVARFNSQEMVALREEVDRWLGSNELPSHLYDRSDGKPLDTSIPPPNSDLSQEKALKTVSQLRTMANFFQEFGTAIKIDSLNERYAHELLGAVCIRYATSLEPFIMETRKRRQHQLAYQEVFSLKSRMESLDKERL